MEIYREEKGCIGLGSKYTHSILCIFIRMAVIDKESLVSYHYIWERKAFILYNTASTFSGPQNTLCLTSGLANNSSKLLWLKRWMPQTLPHWSEYVFSLSNKVGRAHFFRTDTHLACLAMGVLDWRQGQGLCTLMLEVF